MNHFGDIIYFLSYLRFQFLTAEETPEEPPPVTDSATLKHFAREAEVEEEIMIDCVTATLSRNAHEENFARSCFCEKCVLPSASILSFFYLFVGEPKL